MMEFDEIVKPKTKWKKILYEDQGVPDNFADHTFLEELKRNLNTHTYEFWPVVLESGVVTQQVSSICIFMVVFRYQQLSWLSPQSLFLLTMSLAIVGYAANELIDTYTNKMSTRTRWDDFKTMLIFVCFSYGLSPVMMTLTDTVSTDTIYAMTTFMLIFNLLFHDYGADAALGGVCNSLNNSVFISFFLFLTVSQSISLNASIFAAVCLASRLTTTLHAFSTVTFALETFALSPMLRRKIKKNFSVHGQAMMTVVLSLVAGVAIYSVSVVALFLFAFVHVFITFACPAWLINLQYYKETIHGPWDEAVIKD